MKNLFLTVLCGMFFLVATGVQAQSLDELKSMKSDKEAALAAIQAEVDALDKQIYTFPGWKVGGVGVAGFNLLSNNDWYQLNTPNSQSSGLNIGLGAFANLDVEKYFWRNLLDVAVARTANFGIKGEDATKSVALTNGLNLSSLFGYKLSPKWALSAEGRWTSTILTFDPGDVTDLLDDEFGVQFNAPGQATLSAGLTWLPINNLVVLIHPLGYQKNWPGEFISSAGAKIGATYAGEIVKGIAWTSNLSAFIPYGGDKSVDFVNPVTDAALGTSDVYSAGDLTNWEWTNGFSTSLWKGVGLAFNLGLRQNRQQADLQRAIIAADAGPTQNSDENPLQSFYTLGLSYTF